MIVKNVSFSMIFGQSLPGFAMTPDSIAYYPDCRPESSSAPSEISDGSDAPALPTQDFELTVSEGPYGLRGILRSEHGCQKIDDIVESPFSLSFTAFSGSEGVEVFRYTLMFSDSTDQLVGFACGVKPFFRSFMPLRGKILERG